MVITIVMVDAIIMTDGLFHLIAAEKYILSSVIMMSEELLLKERIGDHIG
jgi:hypothetical protein